MCSIICENKHVLPSNTCTSDKLSFRGYHVDGKKKYYPVQSNSKGRVKSHVGRLVSLVILHHIPMYEHTGSVTHLNTWSAKIHTKAVCILTVMFNQLLQCPERSATRNEKATFVKLSDPIMFHCISISNCNTQTMEANSFSIVTGLWTKQQNNQVYTKAV
jgi:hypothetical protein